MTWLSWCDGSWTSLCELGNCGSLLSAWAPWENVQFQFFDKVKSLSRVWFFVTPWTVTYQASPSMGFPRQEYWSGLTFPSPGNLPNPGIEPTSAWQAVLYQLSHQGSPLVWAKPIQDIFLLSMKVEHLENSVLFCRGAGFPGDMQG